VASSGAAGDPASPPEVTRHSSVPCRPQAPCFWWVNENAFASLQQARPCPTLGRPVHLRGGAPRLRPVLLLMPFRFRLTTDTLPSGNCKEWLQVRLGCLRLSSSCPVRLFHTFLSPRPTRSYPRLWIQRSSFERRRDLNPPESRAAQRTIRLVDSPRPVGVPQFRAAATIQFRRIPLNPAPDRDVIHAQVPLGHHLFQLAEAQRIPQVPADA